MAKQFSSYQRNVNTWKVNEIWPLLKMDEMEICFSLLKNVHYTYEGQDQASQKGEKINGYTQTKVYIT